MSRNGTFLNGIRILAAQHLSHNDIIVLAGMITFVFKSHRETAILRLTESVDLATARTGVAESGAPALSININTAEVLINGRTVAVRPKEYQALTRLYGARGALVSKQQLAEAVWPERAGVASDDDIAQIISSLRRKLEHDTNQPQCLVTVRGFGYRLNVP